MARDARSRAAIVVALCHAMGALGAATGRASMRASCRPLRSRTAVSCVAGPATLYQQDGDLAASRVSGSNTVKPGNVLSLDDGRDALVLYQRNEFSMCASRAGAAVGGLAAVRTRKLTLPLPPPLSSPLP
jgi:hypothetical protein